MLEAPSHFSRVGLTYFVRFREKCSDDVETIPNKFGQANGVFDCPQPSLFRRAVPLNQVRPKSDVDHIFSGQVLIPQRLNN